MATKYVIVSDLSGSPIDENEQARLVVLDHPDLNYPVKLDVAESEIAGLASETSFVVVEVTRGGKTERLVLSTETFNSLFKGDVAGTLRNAERVNADGRRGRGRPRGSGSGQPARRDPEQLKAIRTWARQNGWPDLGERGRIPREAEDAYEAAHR